MTGLLSTCFLPLTLLVSVSIACFITNCPPGGKRSGISFLDRERTCVPCGDNKGTCYGPHICCSPSGCHINTPETAVCALENVYPNACKIPGKPCGNGGNCAAGSVCCTSETCSFDKSCEPVPKRRLFSPSFDGN